MFTDVRIHEYLTYRFTREELFSFGERMAEIESKLADLDNRKRQTAEKIKSEITEAEGERAKYAKYIREKSDMRDVECCVYFDEPEPGMKTIRRMDTFEAVRMVAMTEYERQRSLQFQPVDEGESGDAPAEPNPAGDGEEITDEIAAAIADGLENEPELDEDAPFEAPVEITTLSAAEATMVAEGFDEAARAVFGKPRRARK